jgi:hypothetical protein
MDWLPAALVVRSGPAAAWTILLFHTISARSSKNDCCFCRDKLKSPSSASYGGKYPWGISIWADFCLCQNKKKEMIIIIGSQRHPALVRQPLDDLDVSLRACDVTGMSFEPLSVSAAVHQCGTIVANPITRASHSVRLLSAP